MTDSILMEMFYSLQNLVEKISCIYIINSVIFNNIIEEFPSVCMLHYKIKFILCFNDLVKLNDFWMPDLFQYLDLSRDSVDIHLILNLRFFKNFDCHFFLSDCLNTKLYFTKRSLTKLFVNKEMRDLFGFFLFRIASFWAFAHYQELEHVLLPLQLCFVFRGPGADFLIKNVIHR